MDLPPELESVLAVMTYSCRRGCFYCYNDLLSQSAAYDRQKMRTAILETLSRSTRPVTVELIGGEPLQGEALDETLALLEVLHAHQHCQSIVVSTAVAEPSTLCRIAPWVDFVHLSVDASEKPHNRKRITGRRLRSLVELFAMHGVRWAPSVVLYGEETDDALGSFVAKLTDAGVSAVGFSHRTATQLSTHEIDRYVEQYSWLFKLKLVLAPTIRLGGLILETIELQLLGGARTESCACGRNSIAIEPDGRMSLGVCFDHSKFRPAHPVVRQGNHDAKTKGFRGLK